MFPRPTVARVAVFVGLLLACSFLAVQAGYLNFVAGRPYLWKTMYARSSEERNRLADELARAELDLSLAQDELREVELETDRLAGLLDSALAERETLRACNLQLESDISQLRAQYESKSESLEQLQAEVARLIVSLNESAARCTVLEALLAGAQAELRDLRQNISRKIEELANLSNLNDRLLSLYLNSSNRLRVVEEAVSIDAEIYREYRWFYVGERRWSKGIDGQKGTGFNRSEYLSLAVGPHYSDTERDSFAKVLGVSCKDVEALADLLYSQFTTDLHRVNNILKFVQYLPYIYDPPDDSYVRYPLETLVEGGGDCEDTSVLAAALMLSAGQKGFPVVLLTVDTNGDGEPDHMMVGISVQGASGEYCEVRGTRYYVCETTSTAYSVGQLPVGYRIVEAIEIS